MADVRLVKPAAGSQNIVCDPQARFVFDFPADAATLSRSGDDLVFTFEDGSSIQLENFYIAYSSENMPSFSLEGVEISGQDFFTAMSEADLMPAAGPAASSSAIGNGPRYHAYNNTELYDGLDRLGGLDLGLSGEGYERERDGAFGDSARGDGPEYLPGNEELPPNNGVTVTPENPGDLDDENTPIINDPDSPHDGDGADPDVARDVLTVHESGLENGSQPDDSRLKAEGAMEINAPDGVSSITIDGKVVWENGGLTSDTKIATDEGVLTVTGFDPETGKLEYTYELTDPTGEHGKPGQDSIGHEFEVVVTDRDGDTGSSFITVVIEDDVPEFGVANPVELAGEGREGSLSGMFDLHFGADGKAENGELVVKDGTLDADASDADAGKYVFKVDGGTLTITKGAEDSYSYEFVPTDPDATLPEKTFTLVAKDGDGDTTDIKLTVEQNYTPDITPGGATPGAADNTILVDEGTQQEPEHTGKHEQSGTGSFTVDLHGEDGTITLQYGSDTITLDVKDGESFDPSDLGPITVHGVGVKVTGVEQGTDGKWTVQYDYQLNGNQEHGKDGPETDTELTGEIKITVEDGSGDVSEGSITVEVHDDVPTLGLGEFTGSYNYGIKGTVDFDFGADDGDGSKIELSVDGGKPVAGILADDGKTYTFTVGDKTVTLDTESGEFHYDLPPFGSGGSYEFAFTVTDSDGDVAEKKVTVNVGNSNYILHVKESGSTVDNKGVRSDNDGTLEASNSLEMDIKSVELGNVAYSDPDIIPEKYKLTFSEDGEQPTDKPGYDFCYETNYGTLYYNKGNGDYLFELNDEAADPLPEGFQITASFNVQTENGGTQTIDVVIEGTDDEGYLIESGGGGHSKDHMWIDVKASGSNTEEYEYIGKHKSEDGKVIDQANMTKDQVGDVSGNAGEAHYDRNIGYLPFKLDDPDFNSELNIKFECKNIFSEAYKDWLKKNPDKDPSEYPNGSPSTEGEFLPYDAFDPAGFSVALNVAWKEFVAQFTPEQLESMYFHKTEYGIFVFSGKAMELDGTGVEGPQYWTSFLVDSDSDAVRYMREPYDVNVDNHGSILEYSFSVTDKYGNPVKTPFTKDEYDKTVAPEDRTEYDSKDNSIMVHVYGSRDAPTIEWKDDGVFIDDKNVVASGQSKKIIVEYEDKNIIYDDDVLNYAHKGWTHYLKDDGEKVIDKESGKPLFQFTEYNSNGQFQLSDFKYAGEPIVGDIKITVYDADSGNTPTTGAIYYISIDENGNITQSSKDLEITGEGKIAENIYGGTGTDTLYGGEGDGNDGLWGFEGNDTLIGGEGHDRLYGGKDDDTLYGDDGTKIPVGEGIDILVGGEGNDTLYGGGGDDVLIGDGQGGFQELIEGTVNAQTFQKYLALHSQEELKELVEKYDAMDKEGGDDTLYGGAGDDILIGGAGNDQLFGEDGDDILFGGLGDDYLDGGAGSDTLNGGDGNDIIVYDSDDFLIDGGSGIDFMVSDEELSLDDLLNNSGKEGHPGPMINDIEVLISGDDALSLTNIKQLAEEYGITISKDGITLTLDTNLWKQDGDKFSYTGGKDLTLETTLEHSLAGDDAEVQTHVFYLNNANG